MIPTRSNRRLRVILSGRRVEYFASSEVRADRGAASNPVIDRFIGGATFHGNDSFQRYELLIATETPLPTKDRVSLPFTVGQGFVLSIPLEF